MISPGKSAFIFLIYLCCMIPAVYSQEPETTEDTATVMLDTAEVVEVDEASPSSPAKATLYSAVLPGLGQAYNRSYWKIPIIYAGFALGIIQIDLANQRLQDTRRDLFNLQNGTPSSNLSEQSIRDRIDFFRRQRDQLIIYTSLWYGLQVVEAHVEAHLKAFEVDDNLALKFTPSAEQHPFGLLVSGASMKIYFK